MALQTTTNINVDFYDKEYIMINAKQYDDVSRFISITCYDQGNIMNINEYKHTAYIRYRKADGYGVLNSCRINSNGNVLVELTEQMLAADGICYVDLIIVNKGKAIVNLNTNEISVIDDSPILSTMAFCINVYEAVVDNSEIESSNEYGALNDALQQINADYSEVIRLAKSYAMGNANNIRENEDQDNSKYYYQMSKSYAMGDSSTVDAFSVRDGEETDNSLYYSRLARSYAIGDADDIRKNEDVDNAKYYSKQSSDSATSAGTSEANALASEQAAKNSETASANSAAAALASQNAAKTSETNAKNSETAAKTSASNAKTSETNAKTSESNAKNSETASAMSATNAANSENASKTSETNALNSATSAAESKTTAVNSATSALNSENAAKTSEVNAKTSETNAASSEANALNSYNLAKSYVVGGTGIRENEDMDNAKYYHEIISSLVDGAGIGIATVDEVKSYLGI